ncbi:MAG: hypothetical protein IKV35_01585 [Clostridia bacterium]|nr:hypothetical protein [Clostridia bacterium]
MKDAASFDKALRVEATVERDGMRFYDIEQDPFSIHGVFRDGDHFRRIPKAVSETVSEAVDWLGNNTAGGRVRFVTDSTRVAIIADMWALGKMPHFALTGSVGFDVYADDGSGDRYAGSLIPPFDIENRLEAMTWLGKPAERVVTVNFPLYSGVKRVLIGVEDTATIKAAPRFSDERPVVFYGSSITQGGCASRPGNSYQAILARRLGFDYQNLGFSGSAKAEDTMIDYLASLPMRAFVMDYDHNAPDVAHLEKTHEPLYKAVRKAHPDIPIVMMTRPGYRYNDEELERLAIMMRTYERAVAAGDTAVYVIDGRELFGEEFAEVATVDGCHPNDAGFFAMARRMEPLMKEILA